MHIAWVVRGGISGTATKTKRRSRGVLVVKREGGGGGEQGEHGCLWGTKLMNPTPPECLVNVTVPEDYCVRGESEAEWGAEGGKE